MDWSPVLVAIVSGIGAPVVTHLLTRKAGSAPAAGPASALPGASGVPPPAITAPAQPWLATWATVLGGVSLLAWLLPIVGLPVSMLGLSFGIKGRDSPKRRLATVGIVLSVAGLVASVANSAIGAYMGANGDLFA